MKAKLSGLCPILVVVSAAGAVAPSLAAAETTATVSAANMYLWRGQNLTPDGAQVSGGIEYAAPAGFYGGAWTTTETGGHETDLYAGYGGTAGDFGYDISYWVYLYPEDGASPNDGLGDQDLHEVVLSGSYGPVTAAAYIQTEAPEGTADNEDENNYYTITGAWQQWSLTYGMRDLENPGSGATGADEYSHLTLMYAATDELMFGVSTAFSDLDDGAAGAVEEDPLFYVSYNLAFELFK